MILINEQGKSGISTGDDLPSKPFLKDENTNSPFSMADQFQTQEPKSTLAEIEPIESEPDEITKSRILDQDNFNSLVKQKIRNPELVEGIDQFEEPDRPLFLASSIVKNYSEVNPLFIRNPNILSEEDRMDEINEVSINEFKRTVETPEEFISLWQDKYDKEDKFRSNHESIFAKTREATIKSLASKSGGARWEEVAASIPKEELEENQLSYYSTFSKSRIAQEKALASSLPYLQEVFEMRQSDEIKGQKISLWDIVTFGGMDGEVIANDTESVVSKLENAYMSLDEEGRQNLVSATQTLMQIMPEENRTDLLDRFGNAAGDFATEIIGGASKTVARGVMGVTGVASLEDFDKELVFQRDMTDAMKSSIETKRSDGGDIGQVEEWAGSIAGSVAHGLLYSNPVTATYGALSYMERARTDLFDLGRNSGLSDDDALTFAGKYQAGLGSLYILESGVTNKILFGKFPVMDKALSRISASVGNIYLRGAGRVVTNTAIETTSEVLSNIAPQVVQSVASAVEESGGSQLWAAQGGNDWLGDDGIISDALSKENLSQILSVTLPLSLFGAFGGFSDKKRSLAFAKKITLEQWESIGGSAKTYEKFNKSANSSDPKEQAKASKYLEEGFLNLEPKSERSEQVRKDLAEAMTKAAEEASASKVFPKLVVSKETGKIEVISPETNEVVAVANSPEEATKLAYEFMGIEAEKKDAEYDVLLSLLEAGASLSKEAKDANATFEVDLSKEVNSTNAREQALEDSKSEVEAIAKAGYTRLKSLDESVSRLKELDKLSGGDGNIPTQVIYGENVETETSITRKIYSGANIMDLVHEDGHATRANLIKSGHFNQKRFDDLLVKLNNAVKGKKTRRTGESIQFFVGESPTAKESSEAFAELTEMEVLNTRKGKKTGIRDIVRRFFAAEARMGDVEARNFMSYIRSMKEKYSRVFTRKTIIDKAVRDGKISKKEIDDLRAMLQGTKVEEEQAKEAKKTAKKAKKQTIKEVVKEVIGDMPIEEVSKEELVEVVSSATLAPTRAKNKEQLADTIVNSVYRNLSKFPILSTIEETGRIKMPDPIVKMLNAKMVKNQGIATSKVKQKIADNKINAVYDGLLKIKDIDSMGGTPEGRLAAKKILRSIYTKHDDYTGLTPDQIMDNPDDLWNGLYKEISDIVEGNSRSDEDALDEYYQKLEAEALAQGEESTIRLDDRFSSQQEAEEYYAEMEKDENARIESFELDRQTDESIEEDEKRIKQTLKIKEGVSKRLVGDAGEYGTVDMFDTTAGEMALFNQPTKPAFTKKEVEEAVNELIEEANVVEEAPQAEEVSPEVAQFQNTYNVVKAEIDAMSDAGVNRIKKADLSRALKKATTVEQLNDIYYAVVGRSSVDFSMGAPRGVNDNITRLSPSLKITSVADVVEAVREGNEDTPLRAINEVVQESKELRKRVKAESERRKRPRKTGVSSILERIARERSNGAIDAKTAKALTSFVNSLNERFLEDESLSISVKGSGGMYDFTENLITLFQDRKGIDAHTGVHEFWHSLSKYLPASEVKKMEADYKRELADYIKKNPSFLALVGRYGMTQEEYDAYAFFASPSDLKQLTKLPNTNSDGHTYVINFTKENYRYVMLDEYMAERMADLSLAKQKPKADTVFGRLAEIFQEFLTFIQTKLGKNPYESFYNKVMSPNSRRLKQRNSPLKAPEQIFNPSKRLIDNTRGLYIGERAIKNMTEERKQFMRDSLNTAKAMAIDGKNSKEIRAITGWFPNPFDGKMRWETPDNNAALTDEWYNLKESYSLSEPNVIRLNDAINHPDLFEAYPELSNVVVTKKSKFLDIFGTTNGWFDHSTNILNISPSAKDPLSVMLHEIQHWIQYKENFAKGSNTNSLLKELSFPQKEKIAIKIQEKIKDLIAREKKKLSDAEEIINIIKNVDKLKFSSLIDIYYNANKNLEKAFEDFGSGTSESKDAYSKYNKAEKDLLSFIGITSPLENWDITFKIKKAESFDKLQSEVVKQRDESFKSIVNKNYLSIRILDSDENFEKLIKEFDLSYDIYRNFAGEIESRDVQARASLTPEQRAEIEPYTSENIAPEDAFVVFYDEVNTSSQPESSVDFSMGAPRQSDAKYLELAKDPEGNRDELQKMVDEAAKAANLEMLLSFDEKDPLDLKPMNGIYKGREVHVENMAKEFAEKGWQGRPILVIGNYAITGSHRIFAARKANVIREANNEELIEVPIYELGETHAELFNEWLEDGNSNFVSSYAMFREQSDDDDTRAGIAKDALLAGVVTSEFEALLRAESLSNDGNNYEGFKGDIYYNAAQIKSADPITYDADGNVILLSQRFNPQSDSINLSMGARKTYHADIVKALFDKIKNKEESPYANFMLMKTMADKLGKHKRDTDEVFTAFGKKYTRKALDKEDGFEMSQEQQIRRSYDLFQAMLDSLPVEVRTYVNFNVAALSKKSTNNQRKEYLLEKMDKAEDAFNKYRIAEYRRNIKKTMRAAKPDSKIGRAKGKITPEVHALFDRVEKHMETFLSDDEIELRLNKFDEEIEKIVSKGRTEENLKKIVEINEEKDLFFRFVNYSDKLINRDNSDANARLASELEESAIFLEEARLLGRNRHKTLMEIREAEINRAVMIARAANPEAKSEEILAASRKAGTTKEELKSFFYGLEDLEKLFVEFFGEELASLYIPRFRNATVAVKSSLRKREKAYRDVIEQATGLKGTKLDYYIYDMRTNPTHTFTIKPIDTISESINIDTFISSPDPAKAFGFSPEEVSEINGLIEEELNNPDSNRSEIEFERKIEKEAKEVKLTTSVLIERIMTWKQENYKFNLAKYGYGESFQEKAEKALDKVKGARESMEFMRQEYDASYDKGNEVYRRVNQINLPKWDNYAGTLINYGSNKELEVGGTFNLNGNPYDVTKKRINHEWEIIPTDAFELFIDKTTQMDHYAAYAEVFGEINAITGDVEVKKQMSLNPSLAKRLREYLDDIQRDNSNSWSSPIIDRLLKNRSILYLSYNLPTIAKSTIGSYMNTYLGDVSLADSIRYQKKIFQNNGEIFKKMLYSDEIQNKFHSGSMPEVEFLFNKLKEEKPSQYRNFLMEGMRLVGAGDAYGSTINAAVHYAYHYDSYLEANKDKTEEAEKFAAYKALEQLGRTSQPLHKMDVGATKLRGGSLWNMLTAFTSEPIKKAVIYKNAWGIILKGVKTDKKSLMSNPKTQKAIRQIVMFHAMGLVMEVIGSAWKDSINDDDDEVFDSENWNIGSIALSSFIGNLRVLPIFGDILTQWPKDSGVLKEQKKAMMAMYNMMKIAMTAEELEDGEFWELVLDATRIHYSVGVPARIVEQSVGLIGNLADVVIPE